MHEMWSIQDQASNSLVSAVFTGGSATAGERMQRITREQSAVSAANPKHPLQPKFWMPGGYGPPSPDSNQSARTPVTTSQIPAANNPSNPSPTAPTTR